MAVDITLYRPTVYKAYTERAPASQRTRSLQIGTVALLCLNRTPARSLYMTKRTAFGGSSKWILLH